MKRLPICCFFFLITFQLNLQAQDTEKVEYEERVALEEIPEKALQFIDQLGFDKKVKWYQEFGLNAYTFEAKIRYEKQRYSIEFDSLGQIEDLEVEVASKDITGLAWQQIETWLDQEFGRYRIRKVQLSFSGTEKELLDAWSASLAAELLAPAYELIIKAKTSEGYQLLECRFSNQGALLSRKRILLRNTDNLEY